jgi:hypothetical protein
LRKEITIMIKSICRIIIAMMLCFSMSVSSFASEPGESDSKDVTADYNGTAPETVYSVEITWGSLAFTYNAENVGTWNPDEYVYEGSVGESWTCEEGANRITVTNHSNAAVTATIANSDVKEGITLTWSKTRLELGTADNGKGEGGKGTPVSDYAELTVAGSITDTGASQKLGSVTVTLG